MSREDFIKYYWSVDVKDDDMFINALWSWIEEQIAKEGRKMYDLGYAVKFQKYIKTKALKNLLRGCRNKAIDDAKKVAKSVIKDAIPNKYDRLVPLKRISLELDKLKEVKDET